MRALILLILLTFSLSAQELTPLEIAKKAIEASGGETWRRPKTLQLSGNATLYFNGETYRMTEYKMWRIFPSESDSAHTANGKIRFDARDAEGKTFMQLLYDGKKAEEIFSDAAKQNEQFLRLSNNFGFSIFRFVENPEFKLTRLPDDKIDGKPCYFFKITDAKKSETIFAVDCKTFLIRYAAFQSALGLQQRYYDDFKQVKGTKFMQPRSLRIYNNGVKTTEVFWSAYKVNEPISDTIFEVSK